MAKVSQMFGRRHQEARGNRGVEKTTRRIALCSVLLTKYHSGDKTKKTEMVRACSTYGERCLRGTDGKTRGKDTS
jgi:hypothetical protein